MRHASIGQRLYGGNNGNSDMRSSIARNSCPERQIHSKAGTISQNRNFKLELDGSSFEYDYFFEEKTGFQFQF